MNDFSLIFDRHYTCFWRYN